MSQGTKPAQQTRSKETRAKLVAALEKCLRENRFEDISVAQIAREAGLSVGAVYRRFENKDAFIPVIFELYRDRIEAHAASPEAMYVPRIEDGLRVTLREICMIAWRLAQRERHLVHATHLYARLRPDLIGDDWDELMETAIESSRQIIGAFASEVGVSDTEQAAQVLTYMMNTLLVEKAIYPSEGVAEILTMDDESFVHSMADAMYGYLVTGDT